MKESNIGFADFANGGVRGYALDSETNVGRSDDRLLRMDEAAETLGISRRALYRLIATGELPPPVKVGNASRMLRSEIYAYIHTLMSNREGAAA